MNPEKEISAGGVPSVEDTTMTKPHTMLFGPVLLTELYCVVAPRRLAPVDARREQPVVSNLLTTLGVCL